MPQSIQVYTFETMKNSGQVLDACKKQAAKDKNKSGYPRMLEVEQKDGNVTGKILVEVNDETFACWFAIRVEDGRLVLTGAAGGRAAASEFLARAVEDEPRRRVVFARQISVKQMLRLFRDIAREDRSNIITKLTLHFEPEYGREYAQETYTLIAYSFVENRCASKHKDFKNLCKDAKQMEMEMRIRKCRGVVDEPNGQRRYPLAIKPACTFRMYLDVPLEGWLSFCDAMLGFLNEVDG